MSKPWRVCQFCSNSSDFASPMAFGDHLRLMHSRIEGGSHVCLYGPNGICPLLPYEGVNDRDYETHLAKCHVFGVQQQQQQSSHKQTGGINQQQQQHSNNGFIVSADRKNVLSWPPTANMSSEDEDDHHRKLHSPNVHSNGNNSNKNQIHHLFPSPAKNSRFELDMLGTSTAKPNNIEEPEWTVYSSSQILASSINDPSKHRSYYDNLFTKDWGFHFIESTVAPYATLKKPPKMVFDSYIKKVNRRQRMLGRKPNLSRESSREDNIASQIVPKLFFEENFDLEDSDNFSSLLHLFGFERSEDNLGDFFQQSSMADIQARLSEYLDVVEQDLASQIGKRSKDFFQVMSSMDAVMEQLLSCIAQVSTIRAGCSRMDEFLVKPIGQNIELTLTRNAVRELLKKINWIATVHQTQPTIQLLLSKNDYAGALDLISTSQEVVTQELSGVISFRHLKLQLMEIERVIEQMMNQEFVKYLTAEWNRPTSIHGASEKSSIEEEKLLSIIYGMLKLQKFNFIDTFREEAFTAIKTNVKQTVIEALSSEDSIEVSRIDLSVFQQTKLLPFLKWIGCLRTLFERLLTLLRRVSTVYGVIRDGFEMVSSNMSQQQTQLHQQLNQHEEGQGGRDDDSSKIILRDDYVELKDNLKEILCSVCDFAHSRCAQIIELKVNEGSLDRLDSIEFVELIELIETFTIECEKLCDKKSPNLKLVIQIQSNKFVGQFHDERKRKLMQLLDLEQWKTVNNLSEQFQLLCAELVNSLEKDSPIQDLCEIYNKFKNTKNQKSNKNSNFVVLGPNSQQFVLVNAVINLLYMSFEYCEHASQIPYLAPDFLNRFLELLKLFNSRTSQLVLGAMALQIAGLKTITARTLIICSRSLAFVILILPALKKHFRTILEASNHKQSSSLLKHFDEVSQLYENHYEKIPDKIINLVREILQPNLNKWVAKVPVPSASFLSISQHLKRLHDNIHDFMPEAELIELFENIHRILIESFRDQLTKLKIVNDGGPQHGLVTQELTFYIQSLNNLSIGSKLKLSMVELWPTPS